MKVIALSALLGVSSAIQYRGFGYTTNVPEEQIGSRWGLKPTRTWYPGMGGVINAKPGTVKNPAADYADAVERQRKQFESFSVDSVTPNADFSQTASMDVPEESVGSQWGLKPTQTWIPGPGGKINAKPGTVDDPEGEFAAAEARQKRDTLSRSVDSVVPNVVAQMKHQTTDDLVE